MSSEVLPDPVPPDSIQTRQPLFGFLTAAAGLSLAWLLTAFVFRFLQPDPLAWLGFNFLFALLGLANSLLHFLLVRSARAGDIPTRTFRQIGAMLILAWPLFSLTEAGRGLACFLPGFFNIAGVLGLGIAALIDFSLRMLLFSRQELYSLIHEPGDDNLVERFGRQQEIVFSAYQDMMVLRRNSLLLLVFGILVLAIKSWLVPPDLPDSLVFVIYLAACSSLMSLANSYAEEHRFFLFGIATPLQFQRVRQLWAYALIPVCLLPALLLAADHSLLDPKNLGAWLSWLVSGFRPAPPERSAEIEKLVRMLLPPPAEALPPGFASGPRLNLSWFPLAVLVFRGLMIAALAGALIAFLTRPLREKGFSLRQSLHWFLRRLIRFCLDPLRRLGRFLQAVIRFLAVHMEKLDRPATRKSTIRQYLGQLMSGGDDEAGAGRSRRARRRSLLLYGEFLEWAADRGLDLVLADTPQDIASKTLACLTLPERQDLAEPIRAVTELLEKDLFSRTGWLAGDAGQMRSAVRRLLNAKDRLS